MYNDYGNVIGLLLLLTMDLAGSLRKLLEINIHTVKLPSGSNSRYVKKIVYRPDALAYAQLTLLGNAAKSLQISHIIEKKETRCLENGCG